MSTEGKAVKEFFHSYAEDFDAIYGHSEKRGTIGKLIDKYTRQTMYLRFEESLKHSSNPAIKSVMDIGCGGGRYIIEFLKQGKEVLGLDIASGMIDLAKESVRKMKLDESKVEWVIAGYMDYPSPKKYDAACLMGFFDYIPEPLPLLKKLDQEITQEIYASFPKSNHWLAGQRRVRYRWRNCPLYLYTENEVKSLLDQAGWKGKYELKDFGRDIFVRVKK